MRRVRYGTAIATIMASMVAMLLVAVPGGLAQAAPGDTGKPAPQALVITDIGPYAGIVTKMEGFNWTVTTVSRLQLELIAADEGGLSDYAVVWIPAHENYEALRSLAKDGGTLDTFVRAGGVLVVMGLTPTDLWLDIAPGGIDGAPLPAGGAGVVSIAVDTHPMISGHNTGGSPLAPSDLDPEASGGRGNLMNPPAGSGATVIATNDAGPVIIDHRRGKGHVFVSTLFRERDLCKGNVLLYVQSIAR